VVTGTRTERLSTETPVPTEVLSRRDILRSGARDLGELLQAHPGVDLRRTFRGTSLSLQGLDPENVALLVDGLRVPGRVGGVVDLARYTLRDLERVEVVKGPGAALYGSDAMGGVVNLITRQRTRPREAALTASYGTRSELDVRGSAGLSEGPWQLRLGGGRRSAAGYDLDPADAGLTGSAFAGFDVSGGATWAPAGGPLRVRAEADYLWRDTTGVDALATGAVFDRRGRTELLNTSLLGALRPVEAAGLQLVLRHSTFRDQLLQDQRAARADDRYEVAREQQWEAQAHGDLALPGGHRLAAGVEQALYRLEAARLEGGGGARARTGVYLQDEWAVLPARGGGGGADGAGGGAVRLTLLPGARLDADSQFGLAPSPRLAAHLGLGADVRVRAAYGWGFRAPSFQELLLLFENPGVGYVVRGNPGLRPERSRGATLALDWAPGGGAVQAGLSLFRTELRDLISVVTVREASAASPADFGYRNVSRARSQGGEASVRVRLPLGLWADGGYSLIDARDLGTGELLEGRAVHRATAQLSGRLRPLGLEVSVRGAWTGPRRFAPGAADGAVVDVPTWSAPTSELALRLGWRPFEQLGVFAGVNNLLDAGDARLVPLPPRQVYGGVTAEL
jgi:outer membrane receptor for ferrienterochelin and colicins